MSQHQSTPNTNSLDGINPILPNSRPMTKMNYALVFWSSGIIVQIMVIGQYLLYPIGGLNFIQALVAGIVAAIGVALLMTFQGHAGMRYGIPFIVQGRSSFGNKGTKIVAILRCIPAIAWNGIGTWIGALALEQVTNTLFGFSNIWVYFFLLIILAFFGIFVDMFHVAFPWGKSILGLIEDGGEMIVISITVWYAFGIETSQENLPDI